MSTGAGMPPPAVLGLTAAVLAAHLWLLQRSPPRILPAPSARAPTFNTRSIAPPAPAAPPVAVPVPVPVATAGSGRGAGVALLPAAVAAVARAKLPAVERVTPRAAATLPPAASRVAALAPPPADAAPSAAAASVSIPPSMRLHYQVTARAKQQAGQGTSELAWRHDGASYEARFEVATASSRPRVQHSAGRLGSAGLEPSRFGDRQRGEQATHFDREAQLLVFSNNRPAAPLAAGAQDRLSVLLQLAALVAGRPQRFSAGTTVAIQTATTREAQDWVFTVEGEEQLQLPGGERTALKLTRPPRGEFDQGVEVWLAPGQAYVPVRLRLTQPNGDWVDHQWSATDSR